VKPINNDQLAMNNDYYRAFGIVHCALLIDSSLLRQPSVTGAADGGRRADDDRRQSGPKRIRSIGVVPREIALSSLCGRGRFCCDDVATNLLKAVANMCIQAAIVWRVAANLLKVNTTICIRVATLLKASANIYMEVATLWRVVAT